MSRTRGRSRHCLRKPQKETNQESIDQHDGGGNPVPSCTVPTDLTDRPSSRIKREEAAVSIHTGFDVPIAWARMNMMGPSALAVVWALLLLLTLAFSKTIAQQPLSRRDVFASLLHRSEG